ncbi:MAG: NapC/NirT family cytochrome c [Rhodospirillales bacterium]
MTDMLKIIFQKHTVLVIAAAAIFLILIFVPATRAITASQIVCLGCHETAEYDPKARPAVSKGHADKHDDRPATCVQCHVSEGFVESVYVYTHIFSNTDLLGNWRAAAKDRAGPYYPPIARRAYAVRDAMQAADSGPCRNCHNEENSKPKRKRGQRAHANALKNQETCIECHDNFAHRPVPSRMEMD